MYKKVFLGGTTNDSKWRELVISKLKIEYFDPVVFEWTEERKQEEIRQRKMCQYVLYVISPEMNGLYSLAELVDDSNKVPKKTLFCILLESKIENKKLVFIPDILSSLEDIATLVTNNGATRFYSLDEIADFLNKE